MKREPEPLLFHWVALLFIYVGWLILLAVLAAIVYWLLGWIFP